MAVSQQEVHEIVSARLEKYVSADQLKVVVMELNHSIGEPIGELKQDLTTLSVRSVERDKKLDRIAEKLNAPEAPKRWFQEPWIQMMTMVIVAFVLAFIAFKYTTVAEVGSLAKPADNP